MQLAKNASTQPDKIAAIRVSTLEQITYRELDARSNQLAHVFRAHGLQRGAHVAVYLENCMAYLEILAACLRSGLYITTVNRYLPATEAAYIVDNCEATALIASAALEHSAELGRLSQHCTLKLSVGGAIEGFLAFDEALAKAPIEPVADESIGNFMLYSSGTTGRPKGILRALPEGNPADGNPDAGTRSKRFGFDSSTVYLSPAPLYHGAALGYVTSILNEGGTVILMDRFDPELALELIERHRVTHSQWVPTMFVRMLKLPENLRSRFDLSSHKCAIHAAAPCPVEVKRQMIDWWGPILVEYFSSTEAVAFTYINSHAWLEHPGSVGKPAPGSIHICDDDGIELALGQPGLIYGDVSGRQFTYYKDDDKTNEAQHPTQPNWMSGGDIGYVDEDGYLYLTDRKAFMIISGGVNIYPQQIEDVLILHADVADVAVIGVPNPDLGEEVKAVVELQPGVEPTSELAQELLIFVHTRLGRQLTPRTIEFIDTLPRLPTGKLYKAALRNKYWDKELPVLVPASH